MENFRVLLQSYKLFSDYCPFNRYYRLLVQCFIRRNGFLMIPYFSESKLIEVQFLRVAIALILHESISHTNPFHSFTHTSQKKSVLWKAFSACNLRLNEGVSNRILNKEYTKIRVLEALAEHKSRQWRRQVCWNMKNVIEWISNTKSWLINFYCWCYGIDTLAL